MRRPVVVSVGVLAVGSALTSCGSSASSSAPLIEVAYVADRPDTVGNTAWMSNVDGTHAVELTPEHPGVTSVTWTPDGRRIVFSSSVDGDDDLYSMDLATSEVVQLSVPTRQIVLIDLADASIDNISDNAFGDRYPTWSPDGERLAFTSVRDDVLGGSEDGLRQLYTMRADGSEQTPLVQWDTDTKHADWSPDGSLIAFDGASTGTPQIYVVTSTGDDLRQITTEGRNVRPAIRPVREDTD